MRLPVNDLFLLFIMFMIYKMLIYMLIIQVDHTSLQSVWIPDWPGAGLPRKDLFHKIQLPVSIQPFQVIFLFEVGF